MNILM